MLGRGDMSQRTTTCVLSRRRLKKRRVGRHDWLRRGGGGDERGGSEEGDTAKRGGWSDCVIKTLAHLKVDEQLEHALAKLQLGLLRLLGAAERAEHAQKALDGLPQEGGLLVGHSSRSLVKLGLLLLQHLPALAQLRIALEGLSEGGGGRRKGGFQRMRRCFE